ncbi:hypothetical protein Q5424_13260 [Conexibacter sp. JD483]|uniref:dioxygenase family protein n=1 Tax=unclassified Conexibacter TaxID=2627773 RepID=UPI00271E3515|nr:MULTISPECIES: hypothetical protein [unclassified Conexibacter]MDO8184585.1 hypothetical protein [Conexibacter sp. CPCC 205706]MDO8197891.1 hypothetical protein [Conexibacter sp. CPCC 205762]MDR9370063.1 hypothetical protein [Conexibacter sp. JD483]
MSQRTSSLTRRQALTAAGAAAGGGLLLGRTPVAALFGADPAQAASCASLTPEMTIGPYFVEEQLNRSDITTDQATGSALAGTPLALTLRLVDEDDGCAPVAGAWVDVWHAAPSGKYSDEQVEGTSGVTWLRGYQVSDAAGSVAFKTIWPGWYRGRTVHIHVRVRTFDAAGRATYDFTSQLFFDDALTDEVFAAAPYAARGTRDTRNAADDIYNGGGSSTRLQPTRSGDGWAASFTFGLSGVPSTGAATTTPATSDDTTVAARLLGLSWKRSVRGVRLLDLRLRTREATTVEVRLLRGSRTLERRGRRALQAGTHTLRLPLGSGLHAGRATVRVVVRDGAGNRVAISRIVQLPARAR